MWNHCLNFDKNLFIHEAAAMQHLFQVLCVFATIFDFSSILTYLSFFPFLNSRSSPVAAVAVLSSTVRVINSTLITGHASRRKNTCKGKSDWCRGCLTDNCKYKMFIFIADCATSALPTLAASLELEASRVIPSQRYPTAENVNISINRGLSWKRI